MTAALLIERPAWASPSPFMLVVDGVDSGFGAWTAVIPGRVHIEIRTRLSWPGFLLDGVVRLEHEVAAGTSVRLRLG